MTGFTSTSTFKLYLADPSYVYMTCTIPSSSSTTNTYIECDLDIEKFFFFSYWELKLPNEFPTIYDCQVSYWEKVSKSIYTSCSAQYHKTYKYTKIYEPLCDSSYRNIIHIDGGLYSHGSSPSVPSQFSFNVPALVDDSETTLPCSINYNYENQNWEYRCYISGGSKVKFFETLVTYSKTKIWFMISTEMKLINCRNPSKLIRFLSASSKCTTINSKKTVSIDFSTHIFGFYNKENFILPLVDPSYAYLECTIPISPTSSAEKNLNCLLDINKFPLYSNRKITLPTNFPNINCEVTRWEDLNKLLNIGVCYPGIKGEIIPEIINEPKCAKDDYNMILFSSKIALSLSQKFYLFELNVLVDGKNSVLPCELFTRHFNNEDNYFPIFCYSNKGNSNITFFETTETFENQCTLLFTFDSNKKINLDTCSIKEKTLFIENINIECSVVSNQYYLIVQLYAKISGFLTDYSFDLYLDSPSTYKMSCTIPSSKSDIKELTYIECKLDILKFPLINPNTISLPSKLDIEDINVINWDKIGKVHNCSSCNPKYSLQFSAEEYSETSCYKPYYNKISSKGQMAQTGKYYKFEMNTFVDSQIALLPCELKSLNEDSNDYQLDCITDGKNTLSIFNTFVTDSTSKELIYIQGSHLFTLKECIPTKFITINNIKSECSTLEQLFKIYFYADIKGFSSEESFIVNLQNPTYIYMSCTIPKSGESNQYIYCTIDINKFPLISIGEITLPFEFYTHPECEVKNWDKMPKNISIEKCFDTYQYTFSPKEYLNTDCYLNGYNSFAIKGMLEANNINLKVINITFDVFVNSEYRPISCEIYPPDDSNFDSRLYCYSLGKNNVQMFPTVVEDKYSKEKIFININHIFSIKNCEVQNKMIYFKGIKSECLKNESSLKMLIYSDIVGFNNEEKITINLKYPNPSYMECVIPKSSIKDYIECTLDIVKFPLISKNTIMLPDNFPQISNCYISNWANINNEITTGKCHKDYSLVFSPTESYEAKCYKKNYNAITLFGSLSINGKISFDNTTIHSFNLNSIINGNYDNIECEIYPPDSSFFQYRMYCYTDKINSVKIFQTMANVEQSQENIFINTTNYSFNLLDCTSNDKLIFLKGMNLKYTESLIYLNFYGRISGTTQEESFSVVPNEPSYSSILCLLPSTQNEAEDKIIECKYNITKFPLIKTDTIKINIFPTVQNYALSNWDFINQHLKVGYKHSNYSIIFRGNNYINSSCYKVGYNVFSVVGSIEFNDKDNNITNGQIIKFNNYVKIDGEYANVSCRVFPSINNEYQMDCYTNGKLNVQIFPTIVSEENTNNLILIDYLREYSLKSCTKEIQKTITFQSSQPIPPNCLENGKAFMFTFSASMSGFDEEENVKLNIYLWRNNLKTYTDMNCTIPFQKNWKNIGEINCILDTKKFPLISYTNLYLPNNFPSVPNCKVSSWYIIYNKYNPYKEDCYHPYELSFSFNTVKQECKSKNGVIISTIGGMRTEPGGDSIKIEKSLNFSLSVVKNNEFREIECEIYKISSYTYEAQMDCYIENGYNLNIYRTIVQDTISQKYIFINDYYYNISIISCYNYSKFINFDGNMEIKPNLESSQLQLFIHSQTINFEKNETHRFNLVNPLYSYIDCVFPASNSSNKDYIICSLDTKSFPLTQEDVIILPNELKIENYSFSKWNKVQKKLTNISCAPEHTNTFYSLTNQNSTAKCDDKGNNIITIYCYKNSTLSNTAYNFSILGMVDSQYKSINCYFNIAEGYNQIICPITGQKSVQIFQTMGFDTQNNNNFLLKVDNYIDYTLIECSVSSSTLTIAIVVVSIVVAIVIGIIIFIIVRKKKIESQSIGKVNTLINEASELQDK